MCGHRVAVGPQVRRDAAERGPGPLCRARGSQGPSRAFPLSGGLVAVLGPAVRAFMSAVPDGRHDLAVDTALWERSLSVTTTRGTARVFIVRWQKNRLAAALSRRFRTGMPGTLPPASTARHRYSSTPLTLMSVQLGAGPFGDHGQELRFTVVVDGGDVLVLQLGQAGGDLVAAPGGPADQLVRHPGNLHHGPSPRGDGARLGRRPQRLADLSGHELVVERGGGHGVLVQGRGVYRAPLPVQALPLHGQQQMVMEQRSPRPCLVVAEAGGGRSPACTILRPVRTTACRNRIASVTASLTSHSP